MATDLPTSAPLAKFGTALRTINGRSLMSTKQRFQNLAVLAKFGHPNATFRNTCHVREEPQPMLVHAVNRCGSDSADAARSEDRQVREQVVPRYRASSAKSHLSRGRHSHFQHRGKTRRNLTLCLAHRDDAHVKKGVGFALPLTTSCPISPNSLNGVQQPKGGRAWATLATQGLGTHALPKM